MSELCSGSITVYWFISHPNKEQQAVAARQAQTPTKKCSPKVTQVIEISPSKQDTQGISAHEHWQQSAHLYGDPRKEDELR